MLSLYYNLVRVFKQTKMVGFMISDDELIELAHSGDICAEEELAKRYSKLVRICARPYFLVGGDSEDLIQEGMLGLLSAIRKYRIEEKASFKTFAEQCIRNRLITAIEYASRLKHTPLNDGVSFEYFMSHEPSTLTACQEDSFARQPEDTVLAKEREEEIFIEQTKLLSKFEREVLGFYLTGMSYKEIAVQMAKPEKSIDNAVQRIRKKIAKIH